MSEERKVDLMETVELFDEMVVEKYFQNIDDQHALLSLAGDGDRMHCVVCGKGNHLTSMVISACMNNESLRGVIMKAAMHIAMEHAISEFMNNENEENEEDDD